MSAYRPVLTASPRRKPSQYDGVVFRGVPFGSRLRFTLSHPLMKSSIAPYQRIALAIASVALSASPSIAAQLNFDRLYVFGDSLSDQGNSFAATGQQLPPSPPYFPGRFSNGPVWTDFLGESLTLAPVTLAEAQTAPAPQGINFAFGGASTGTTNNNNALLPPGSPSLPGVTTQVELYQSLAASGAATPDDALYVYWAGANDYVSGSATSAQQPLTNIGSDLEALYSSGARNFLVANLPDLGDSPVGQTRGAIALSQVSREHNQGLSTLLSDFGQRRSDATVTALDTGAIFETVQQNPTQFGFSSTGNCFAIAELFFSTPDPAKLAACGETALFYDELHPTSNAHRLIAQGAIAALESRQNLNVPKPPAQSVPEGRAIAGLALVTGLGLKLLRRRTA